MSRVSTSRGWSFGGVRTQQRLDEVLGWIFLGRSMSRVWKLLQEVVVPS